MNNNSFEALPNAYMVELFPETCRYSGFGVAFHIGISLFGGKVPGAYRKCKQLKDPYFNLLHGIVTHTKHTTVSTLLPDKTSAPLHVPTYEDDIGYICTESGDKIITECGQNIVTEGSKIIVYFGEEIAKHVLEQTLQEFIDPTQP